MMCVNSFRKFFKQLPGDKASHISSKDTGAVDKSRIELQDLDARMTQNDLKQEILKECLEIKIRICNDNIKMDIKETSFVFN